MDVLFIYGPVLFAAAIAAAALCVAGTFLAARRETLQAVVASQSASFGVTVALVLGLWIPVLAWGSVPAVVSLVFTILVYIIVKKALPRLSNKATELLWILFLSLLALNFLVLSLFPSIERHFANSFMGDLATATNNEAILIAALSAVLVTFALARWTILLHANFWAASKVFHLKNGDQLVLLILSGVVIAFSTHIFGFLFTCTSLVVAPFFASIAGSTSKMFLRLALLIAIAGTGVGFLFSLAQDQVSTSASVTLAQVALGMAVCVAKIGSSKPQRIRTRS